MAKEFEMIGKHTAEEMRAALERDPLKALIEGLPEFVVHSSECEHAVRASRLPCSHYMGTFRQCCPQWMLYVNKHGFRQWYSRDPAHSAE